MPDETETEAPEATAAKKPATLEDLLADLDEDRRKVILGEVGKSRKEAKSLRERLQQSEPKIAEYDRLVAASKSDLERAQETAAEFQRRAEAAERAAMVNEIALEKGLPASLARRLQGDDRDALAADADELLTQFAANAAANGPRAPRVDPSQGSSAAGGAAASPEQEFANFIKRARA